MHFLCDMFHFTFEKIVTVMIYMDATCDLYSSIHMFFVFHGVWLSFYWDGVWNNWIYKVYRNSLEKYSLKQCLKVDNHCTSPRNNNVESHSKHRCVTTETSLTKPCTHGLLQNVSIGIRLLFNSSNFEMSFTGYILKKAIIYFHEHQKQIYLHNM